MKRRLRVGQRLTGVSSPFGGVSWEKVPDLEREILLRLLPFLEDRRVLYSPTEVEVPAHCVESVLRIREFLVMEAGRLAEGNALRETLRAMAGACRGFLDRVPGPHGRTPLGRPDQGRGFDSWVFNQSLGALRGQFGIYLSEIAAAYGIKMEGELGAILPPSPDL